MNRVLLGGCLALSAVMAALAGCKNEITQTTGPSLISLYNLYPAATVILAVVLLGERVRLRQVVGMVLAGVAVLNGLVVMSAIRQRLEPFGHRVDVVVNYDHFGIVPELLDDYAAMVKRLAPTNPEALLAQERAAAQKVAPAASGAGSVDLF